MNSKPFLLQERIGAQREAVNYEAIVQVGITAGVQSQPFMFPPLHLDKYIELISSYEGDDSL